MPFDPDNEHDFDEREMMEKKKIQKKVKKVLHEMKEGKLHSGSKKGPVVTNPRQGLAIALSEAGVKKKK